MLYAITLTIVFACNINKHGEGGPHEENVPALSQREAGEAQGPLHSAQNRASLAPQDHYENQWIPLQDVHAQEQPDIERGG